MFPLHVGDREEGLHDPVDQDCQERLESCPARTVQVLHSE